MHIKQVVIEGFKSFKDKTVLDPFDARHNVIVGSNGSGKSNFFHAIQFVLGDEYARLRSDQLQNLLYEGTGPRVISAYVEILFDNTDGRLPIEKKDVFIKRLIGSKKDQHFINGKTVARHDIMNLLESAGFSKSNPHYIIKQGKINQMATAPDAHRLKLLREVAGTRVYDDKCRESRTLLKESEGKIEKIVDLLKIIDERLKDLEGEKEELKHFQQHDNQRRYLEYSIYDRELKSNQQRLRYLKNSHSESQQFVRELNDELKVAQEAVCSSHRTLKDIKKEVNSLKDEKDNLSFQQQEIVGEMEKLSFMQNDSKEEIAADKESRERAGQELQMLGIEIANQEEALGTIIPQYEEIKNIEEDCTRELALKEIRRTELYAKLGRVAQFTDREDRDGWIHEELKNLEMRMRERENHQSEIQNDVERDNERENCLDSRTKELNNEMVLQTTSITERNEKYERMIENKNQCQANQKEQYRNESILQLKIVELKEGLGDLDRSLRSMIGNSTLNGRDSVIKVIDTFREREETADEVPGYYGLLIDNFKCDKSVYLAIEVTAGNRLFNHLIETDSFSTKILKEMNKQNLPGEASFMPLNRINARAMEYPESNDAIPMISKIDYDPKFDKVFRYVFGRTLICRNLDVATMLARSTGLDCVTIEGDQISSLGVLTGGYYNSSRSRMNTHVTRSELIEEIDTVEQELDTLKQEIRETENNIVYHVSNMQKAETKNSRANDKLELIKAEIKSRNKELETIRRLRISKEQRLAECASDIQEMKTAKEGLERELTQELTAQLSVEDQEQVDTLVEDIRRLTKENKEAFAKRIGLEAEKNKLENLLHNNLMRRREELVQALQELSVGHKDRKLKSYDAQFRELEKKCLKITEDLRALNEKISEAVQRQKLESAEAEKYKTALKDVLASVDKNAKSLEKLAASENMIIVKIDELIKKISELEALPNHADYVELTKLPAKELLKRMEKVNKALKNYSHVNKKALEQYMSFSEQKNKLGKRKKEMDNDYEKIEELMTVLEQRKYEAIQFTFKQVSKYFGEIFGKLVPSGKAQLVMQTKEGNEEEPSVDLGDESYQDSDRFAGIGIRVSFIGQNAEMREMNQLSGGQKSIVALALIFAIQKCDPAPFYIFDEIDQALDTEHRIAVAHMIFELSENAQFITTTFRPELLKDASKFYCIKFRNNVSHVECITLEEAAAFVQEDRTQ